MEHPNLKVGDSLIHKKTGIRWEITKFNEFRTAAFIKNGEDEGFISLNMWEWFYHLESKDNTKLV